MGPKIKQLKSTTFNGRRFTRQQLSDMQRSVTNFPKLSRNDLAQTICENLKWRTPSGGNSYQVCLGVLRQLEQLGVLQLPPKVESQRHGGHKFFADRTRRAIAFASPPSGPQPTRPLSLRLLGTESQTWQQPPPPTNRSTRLATPPKSESSQRFEVRFDSP